MCQLNKTSFVLGHCTVLILAPFLFSRWQLVSDRCQFNVTVSASELVLRVSGAGACGSVHMFCMSCSVASISSCRSLLFSRSDTRSSARATWPRSVGHTTNNRLVQTFNGRKQNILLFLITSNLVKSLVKYYDWLLNFSDNQSQYLEI